VTDLVERYTVESLLLPEASARVMRPQLRQVDVHWHDFYEFCLVTSGSADHILNGAEHRIGPGSAFLLSPADFHEIKTLGAEPLSCYNTVIAPHVMERQLDLLGPLGADSFPWTTEDLGAAERDFERLQREFDAPSSGSNAMANALVTSLLVELARRCGRGAEGSGSSSGRGPVDDLQRAVLYVDRHFREPLSLADAAVQAHLSPNYFSERFRAYTGTSFQSYLQGRRLRFARSLLGSTSLGITEVCHAAGFNSLSHFGRAYRRRYGEAPSARRDRALSAS
jgi:AraC-like DNA-binding protein